MPIPIKERIAAAYRHGIKLIDLAEAVFPPRQWPKAWRYATGGGPYAWVRILKPALKRHGYRISRSGGASVADTVWLDRLRVPPAQDIAQAAPTFTPRDTHMKTHYTIDVEPASESDPEGHQVLACGRDGVDHTTRNAHQVTCQACRRTMRPMKRHQADSRSR